MPRTTINKTTRNAASTRDTRHENGLAPPGKRLPRQRSNGQLNGLSNGKPQSTVAPPALPSTGLNHGFKFPRSADSSHTTTTTSIAAEGSSAAAIATDHVAALDEPERDRTPSDASLEEVGPCGEVISDLGQDYGASTPSMESAPPATAAGRATPANAPGTMSTVSNILTCYPLHDAISILIILLSLPPALVLVIQTLFASLTFVPPTAGLSLSTLPNIKEIFNSPNFGYPAMATILLVDCVFALAWLTLWKPAQAIFLDLSQAVIAISLSGAAASSGGPTYSIATCTFLVCIVHVLRYKAIHLTALDYLRSVLHKYSDFGIPFDASVSAQSFTSLPTLERGMFFSAFRTILGIHIVSQGVTTCIRRTLAKSKAASEDSNQRENQSIPAIIRTDPEATAGTQPPSRHSTGFVEGTQPPQVATSSDGRPPGQPPASRESRARDSNSKKKRKQANQVRSQQPLWAAIASTKVTFVKEMEQRDAADDAREAAVMDNNASNTFGTNTNATNNRIWFYEVCDTEVYFTVVLTLDSAAVGDDIKEESMTVIAGIDRTKPFFVRINGAAWSSTRITSQEQGTGNRFVGEIFGLAPMSSYLCEIVSIAGQRVLCSASLITQSAPTAEQAAAVPPPAQHQALRPSSPITTLKQSIASAEIKLNEARNRSRKSKKDQRAAHADIKKEINTLRTKLDSSNGIDDKQERRLQQISQHKNQAEEATKDLQAQIHALGEIPEDERAESEAKRRLWQSAVDAVKSAQRELDDSKAEQEREANAMRAELSASESKKEKLAARITQRAQELEKLSSKQQADAEARQARETERALEAQSREKRQNEIQYLIAQMENELHSFTIKAHEAYQQTAALSGWPSQPPAGYPGYSSPPTPEGNLPGTANGHVSPQANGAPHCGPNLPFTSHFPGGTQPAQGFPRGRSSSMLSQYSGFTDNGEDYPDSHPQTHQAWLAAQNQLYASAGASEHRTTSDGDAAAAAGEGSFGSGSQSDGASGPASVITGGPNNGSNSPRPEAKPFVPGSVPMTARPPPGVIGPPNKKSTQTPPQSPTERHAGAAVGDGNR